MNYLSARLLTTFAALLAVAAGHAHADYLNWTYTSSSSVPGVSAGQAPNTALVSLTGYSNQAGALSIPVIAYEATPTTTPVNFSSSPYTLTLAITDNTTHDTGTLTFNGTINGSLSATNSGLTSQFSASSNSLSLDGHTYTVSIPTANLVLSSITQPSFNATVSVSTPNVLPHITVVPGPVQNTPEPASLILAGLGFSLLGAGRWWKQHGRPLPYGA